MTCSYETGEMKHKRAKQNGPWDGSSMVARKPCILLTSSSHHRKSTTLLSGTDNGTGHGTASRPEQCGFLVVGGSHHGVSRHYARQWSQRIPKPLTSSGNDGGSHGGDDGVANARATSSHRAAFVSSQHHERSVIGTKNLCFALEGTSGA